MVLKSRNTNFRLGPSELGLAFSMPEIEACVAAFLASRNAGQTEPCYKTVILEFRNGQKSEAQAA